VFSYPQRRVRLRQVKAQISASFVEVAVDADGDRAPRNG